VVGGGTGEEGDSKGGTGGGEGTIITLGDELVSVVMATSYIEARVEGC
jgi:hypothetical protein